MRWGVRSPLLQSQTMDSLGGTTATAGVALSAVPANRGSRVSRQHCRREQPDRSFSAGRRRRPSHELCAAAMGRATVGRTGGPLFRGSRRRRPARPLLRYNIVHVNDARYVTARQITGDRRTDDCVRRGASLSLSTRFATACVSGTCVWACACVCVWLPPWVRRVNVPRRKFARAKVSTDALCDKFNRFFFVFFFSSVPPLARFETICSSVFAGPVFPAALVQHRRVYKHNIVRAGPGTQFT